MSVHVERSCDCCSQGTAHTHAGTSREISTLLCCRISIDNSTAFQQSEMWDAMIPNKTMPNAVLV